jgi:hypothetical protein
MDESTFKPAEAWPGARTRMVPMFAVVGAIFHL